MARLPQVLAAAQLELQKDKREIATDTARVSELLGQARRPPCEQCLRPASPCKERCLRDLFRQLERMGAARDDCLPGGDEMQHEAHN